MQWVCGGVHSHHSYFLLHRYDQTLKVLKRVNLSPFDYVLRIRADNYISTPINVMAAVGAGGDTLFPRAWREFQLRLGTRDPEKLLTAWFMCAATPRYIPKMISQRPAHMAVSPVNTFEYNTKLLSAIGNLTAATRLNVDDVVAMQAVVRSIAIRQRVVFISGGLFLHFGPTHAIVDITSEDQKFTKFFVFFVERADTHCCLPDRRRIR